MNNKKDLFDKMIKSYSVYKLEVDDYEILFRIVDYICSLNGYNFTSVDLIKTSDNMISLKIKNKIIRIIMFKYDTETLSDYMLNSRYIQQPNYEFVIKLKNKKFSVLEFDLLENADICYDDVKTMFINLRKQGFLWYAPQVENLGRDNNGQLYVTNYDKIIYIGGMSQEAKSIEIFSHAEAFSDLSWENEEKKLL